MLVRDDIESIGYVLVYLALGRLPWMRVGKEKGKGHLGKVLEKKLITPPEILCKKLPRQFAFLFQYLRKLKFEERPDYNMIKCLFGELFISKFDLAKNEMFSFDWFIEINKENKINIEDDKFTLKNKDKSSLDEINENEEIKNDKVNNSSKISDENEEDEDDNKEEQKQQDNLNKEKEGNNDNENLINDSNKEEVKNQKSSSESYGLIKSDSKKNDNNNE